MGAKTYGPDASQEKILKQEASYAGRAIYRHFQATKIPKYCTVLFRAGIFKESMGARNRGGIGLSYRPARLHRLAELIPWDRFLGSINV